MASNVKNPFLYDRLKQLFSPVAISNYGMDAIWDGNRVIHWGETYHVNCPICGDGKSKRKRLYISHLWSKQYPYLVKCHNETGCFSGNEVNLQWLLSLVWDNIMMATVSPMVVSRSWSRNNISSDLLLSNYVQLPKDYVLLDQLHENHPAVSYVLSRNFCHRELSRYFFVGFSALTPDNVPRLVIPIYNDNRLVGWQGRSIQDGIGTKYYNCFLSSWCLYNVDNVVRNRPDYVVIFEGVTDVWRYGHDRAVASFGCHLSSAQMSLLADIPVWIIVYDADVSDKHLLNLCAKIYKTLSNRVRVITHRLSDGRDPADWDRDELRSCIDHIYMETIGGRQYEKSFYSGSHFPFTSLS